MQQGDTIYLAVSTWQRMHVSQQSMNPSDVSSNWIAFCCFVSGQVLIDFNLILVEIAVIFSSLSVFCLTAETPCHGIRKDITSPQYYEENQVSWKRNIRCNLPTACAGADRKRLLFKESLTIFRLLQGVLVVGVYRTTGSHGLQPVLLECCRLAQYHQNHARDAGKTIQSESKQL